MAVRLMTELLLAAGQTGSFHETRYADELARHYADEWRDNSWLVPMKVAYDLGIPSPSAQINQFAAPVDRTPDPNDPTRYLSAIYSYLESTEGLELLRARGRAAALLNDAFAADIAHMREWWREGYFPRMGSVRLGGEQYEIYNHQPAFAFTGDVRVYNRLNLHTAAQEPWFMAEFDMSPLTDGKGDYVSYDPDVPVLLLPSMVHEPRVTKNMALAHLHALRSSLAPWVVDSYAPHLLELPTSRIKTETFPVALEGPSRSGTRRAMAQVALFPLGLLR